MEESGATVAWKLLATLEGGTCLLVVFGFLVHAVRTWIISKADTSQEQRGYGCLRVMITNQHTGLRRRMAELLKAQGCTIVTSNTISGADDKFDVLIIIGSYPKRNGLPGLSDLVADDVFGNLKLLDSLIKRVTSGGQVLWVSCKGDATCGAFAAAADAFDELIKSQLQQIALASSCKAVWVGRHQTPERAAQRVVSLLMPRARNPAQITILRTLAARMSYFIYRRRK